MTIASPPDSASGTGRGWFIALGVILIILGLVALWNMVDATLVTTVIIGWVLVIAGVMNIVGAFTSSESAGWRILQGVLAILYILVGFNVIADPFAGAIAITVVFGALLIADGIFRIVASFMDGASNSVWMILLGILNILLGLWLWTGIPFSGVAIGLFVGIELLVAGTAWLVAGFMSGPRTEPAGA